MAPSSETPDLKTAALNPSNSRVANESYRFGHAQPEGLHHFQNPGKAGAPVFCRLVALHLLWLDPKASRQALVRHSRRYACSDQGSGQICDAFENHSLAAACVEPLV